jgi:surface antigen
MNLHLRLRIAPLMASLLLAAVMLPATPGRAAAATYSGYNLPFAGGTRIVVTQTWCGSFSHHPSSGCVNAYDFANPSGTTLGMPVVAAMDGDVVAARTGQTLNQCGGSGADHANYVKISHANGTQTWYWHLNAAVVVAGRHVHRGQLIGFVGNTGFSCGAHLHFQLSVNSATYSLAENGGAQLPYGWKGYSQNYQTTLTATRTSGSVSLTWVNSATDSPRFVVQRSFTSATSGWSTLASRSPTIRSYTDSIPSYVSPIWYRVGAETNLRTMWSPTVKV